MTEKKKILYLVDMIETGGAEKVIIRVAQSLKVDTEPFLSTAVKSKSAHLYDLKGIRYFESPVKGGGNIINTFFQTCISIKKLVQVVRKYKIDTIICFLERSNVIGFTVAKLTGCNVIVSVRNNLKIQYEDRNFITKSLIMAVLKFVYRRADKVLSLSIGIEEQLREVFKLTDNLITIYNPYLVEEMIESSSKEIKGTEFDFNKPYFSAVGRYSQQKGFDYLIKIYYFYKLKGGENKLYILGDGESYSQLLGLIEYYNLQKDVFLTGYRNDVPAIVAKSEAFLFSSLWEGFGNAAIETLAYGTPLIACDCNYGPREILDIPYSEFSNYPLKTNLGVLLPCFSNRFCKDEPLSTEESLFCNTLLEHDRGNYISSQLQSRAMHFDQFIILPKWEKLIRDLSA